MYISIDFGGTTTRVASSFDLKTINKSEKFKTEKNLFSQKAKIEESLYRVTSGVAINKISIGLPGIVNVKEKKVEQIKNVPYLNGLRLKDIFSVNISEEQIYTFNDAYLSCVAESIEGAGKDFGNCAFLTLSTGVGGAFLIDKHVSSTQVNFEPGHMIINSSEKKPFDLCGHYGCFSQYCSGTAFEERYGENPFKCTDKKIWQDYAKWLSIGLYNLLLVWTPDVIVLGGRISTKLELFSEILYQNLFSYGFGKVPPIVRSHFEDLSGVQGGFIALRSFLK